MIFSFTLLINRDFVLLVRERVIFRIRRSVSTRVVIFKIRGRKSILTKVLIFIIRIRCYGVLRRRRVALARSIDWRGRRKG